MFNFKKSRAAKGFTLIELLVVVVIVGILAAVALPNFLGQSGKAKTTEATVMIDAIKSGQESYLNERGGYFTDATATAVFSNSTELTEPAIGGTLVPIGATIAELNQNILVNPDPNKFASGILPIGNSWGISTKALTVNTATIAAGSGLNYGVSVDGGLSNAAGTNLRGLAASYVKAPAAGRAARVVVDPDQTQ